MTEGKASFPKVLYGGRREMMPQRMIILKHRRNRAGRHKTGCPSLKTQKESVWNVLHMPYKDFTNLASQGVLRVILGGGVSPSSPNPDPISDQKLSLSTPFFRPDL